ncbi:MAG: hypothetical protein HY000_11740 [Planctomycetes bacterium]|nr:hypothetical protein [Planctomycetota bacterium]
MGDQRFLHRWMGRRRWVFGGVLLALVLVAGFIGPRVWRQRQIDAERARIRAAGEPLTGAELNAMYRVPPGEEDTTQLWLKAIGPLYGPPFWANVKDLPIVGGKKEEPPPPGQPWVDLEAAETVLAQYGESLEQLHKLANSPGTVRFPIELSGGFGTLMEHVQCVRNASHLLQLEAHARAHRGDVEGATQSIRAIFATARTLRLEPCLVSQLVRARCDAAARKEIEWLLAEVEFSDQVLADFQSDLRAAGYEEGLYRVMLGERAMGTQGFDDPSTMLFTRTQQSLWRWGWSDDLYVYLTRMRQMVESVQKPWPEMLKQIDRFRIQRSGENWSQPTLGSMRSMLSRQQAGAIANRVVALAKATALNRAAEAALGVERYRRRHGRLPERLEDVVPEFLPAVPEDPFTGQPLRYAIEDGGFVVYSVGPDGVDDRGQETKPGQPEVAGAPSAGPPEPADVVFRVRQERRSQE